MLLEFRTRWTCASMHWHCSCLRATSPASDWYYCFCSPERGCITIGLQKKSPQAVTSLLIFGSLLVCFQDKVATESLPLLGFTIAPEKEEGSTDTVFHLYHKQTLFYSFRAEDNNSAQRYGDRLPRLAVCRCKSFSRVFLSFTSELLP